MIALGTVHPGTVTFEYHSSVAALLKTDPDSFTLVSKRSSALIAQARNEIFWWCVENPDVEVFLSVDSDMLFGPSQAHDLIAHVIGPGRDFDICTGLYAGVHEGGETFPVLHHTTRASDDVDTVGDVVNVERAVILPTQPEAVDGIGLGFCAIGRTALDAFAVAGRERDLWPFEQVEWRPGLVTDEDVTFSIRAADLDLRIGVDPGIRVGHVKSRIVYA